MRHLTDRPDRRDGGASPLEVLAALMVIGFVGAIVLVGARAMSANAQVAASNHQLAEARDAVETAMGELSDAGPVGGLCLDPADDPAAPVTDVGDCRSSRALPFELVSATDTQVCFYGRAVSGVDATPDRNPDRVCLAIFADTFLIKRWEATGTWTTPTHASTETQSELLGSLDSANSQIIYYDALGQDLGVPSASELAEIALVELQVSFTETNAGGDGRVDLVFTAPIRGNLYAAGD